jgi:hypothetical protein
MCAKSKKAQKNGEGMVKKAQMYGKEGTEWQRLFATSIRMKLQSLGSFGKDGREKKFRQTQERKISLYIGPLCQLSSGLLAPLR